MERNNISEQQTDIATITNQLFVKPQTPFGAYPFDRINVEHFKPSMLYAIDKKREEVLAISLQTSQPSFANTILALENSGKELDAVSGAFYNLLHAHTSDQLMELAQEFSPLMSKLSSEITLNRDLFKRIKAVYDAPQDKLDAVDKRLLKNCYDGFVKGGALLEGDDRVRYQQIKERLSILTLQFAQNKLKDENAWSYTLPLDSDAITALPESIKEDARNKALEKDAHCNNYLFGLSAPHYSAIMRFCTDSSIRETFYIAKMSIGANNNEYNNQLIVLQISNLRLELAKLLGYKNFAAYKLHDCMLSSEDKVLELLKTLEDNYKSAAENEIKDLEALNGGEKLNPWDLSFFFERYSEQHYGIREEELRPYFSLDHVIKGVFEIATKLYGISFVANTSIPTFHKDVTTYEVRDSDDSFLGLLYLDFFPRNSKQSGAWMNNLQEQEGENRPHIILVMNFTPPTSELPSLLTPSEVTTFLHEFGHALHGLLTHTRYTSLSGTNVSRDFVELPSQFMENYFSESSVVQNVLSSHYISGQPLPEELLEKLIKSSRYPAGYATMRQLTFGVLDMAYHTIVEPLAEKSNLALFESQATANVHIGPAMPAECNISTGFSHIFAGGYASGYYGYKWSEVLDADAFAKFKEEGIFNKEVATSFRKNILEQGDSAEAMDLYVAFRGRRPTVEALIKRDLEA